MLVVNNETKLVYLFETIKINEKSFINIKLNEKRNNKFFDVIFNLNGKEIFLGRFAKDFNIINAKYKDGKILIYYENFNQNKHCMTINKVLSLYDILDDTFYSCTEIEALNIFDSSIDSSYLKQPENLIHRSDVEKSKRLYK